MKIKAHNFKRRNKIEGLVVCQEISFETDDISVCDEFFTGDLPSELQVEIKRVQRNRSLDANAYFWTLADKVGKKLLTTKEEIYREIIRRVGVFYDTIVKEDEAENVIRDWQRNGVGWIAERQEYYGHKNHAYLRLYKGSSVYTTSEMSRLIDEIVSEAKSLGVDTLTPNEKEELLQRWNVKT